MVVSGVSAFDPPESVPGKLPRRWVIVAACFFIAVMTYGCTYSFGIFFRPMRQDFGWTSAATSGVFSMHILSYCWFSILSGWAVDRFGGRATISLGSIFIGLGLLLTSQAKSLLHIYIGYGLLAGAGMSTVYGPLQAITLRWFEKQKGLALGIVSSGIGTGAVMGPILASYLISLYGWRFCYILMGLVIGLSVITVAVLFLGKAPPLTGEDRERQAPVTVFERNSGIRGTFSIPALSQVSAFWLLAGINLMIGFGLQTMIVHTVPFAQETFGLSSIAAAGALSNMGVASIFGRLIMGAVSDHIGRKRALIISTLTEGFMIMALANSPNASAFYIFAIFYGFAYGGHAPQIPGLTGELFGLQRLGTIIGVLLIFYGAGAALGPFMAGYVVDTGGSYRIALVLGGIAMFLSTGLSLLIGGPRVAATR
jgi:MFS family permease